jgi:phosphate starvation-inducible protein PhoH and related proteins
MSHKLHHTWQDARDEDVIQRITARDKEKEKAVEEIKPLTKKQGLAFKAFETSTLTLLLGAPGAGKTFCAVAYALNQFHSGKVKKIIVSRPLVTCGQSFGYLPGDLGEKITPFMAAPIECIAEIIGKEKTMEMLSKEQLQLIPLELMRGRTIQDAVLVCDEAQNTTYVQLHMLLTRMGRSGKIKVIITGDTKQDDLKYTSINPLAEVAKRLYGHNDISIVKFEREDCVRHPLVQFIDERLSADGYLFELGDDSAEEVVVKGENWYRIICPICKANVWFNDGDGTSPSVDQVRCWKCEALLGAPAHLDDDVVVEGSEDGYVYKGRSSFRTN